MRCIAFLFLLLYSGLSQAQVVDYWYAQETSLPANHIVLDADGQPVVTTRSTRRGSTHIKEVDGDSFLLQAGDAGAFFIGREVADEWVFENLSKKLLSLPYMPTQTVATEEHFYFIWNSSFASDSIRFFDQTVVFSRSGEESTLSIIQTDKNLQVTGSIDFYTEIEISEIEAIVPGDQGGLFILWSNTTANIARRTANIPIFALQNTFSYNILEFDASLNAISNTIYHEQALRPFYDGFGRRTLQAVRNHFSAGLHFYNTDDEGDFYNEYNLNETLEGKGTETISQHKTNLKISTLANQGDDVFFVGECAYEESLVYFDEDTLLFDDDYAGNALFLSRLNRDGSFKALAEIRNLVNYQNAQMAVVNDQVWLKVHALNTFYLKDLPSFQVTAANQIVYLVYDFEGNLLAAQPGPGMSPTYWYSSFTTDGSYVYDANLFDSYFTVNGQSVRAGEEVFTQNSMLYTKTHIIFPPTEEPDLVVEQNGCSALNIRYRRTDADHYTVLISETTTPNLPIDYQNYTYAFDYLKAPQLRQGTKILYQGPDTALSTYHLPAGRRYTVAVVPGNGPSGATLYNTDSMDTVSIVLAASIWQDSIALSSAGDTAACPMDSFYYRAQSPWPLSWMDGKKESERLLQRSAPHYFTTMAPDACVLSSDTANYTLLRAASVLPIRPLSEAPFCEGDSVVLNAQASHTYDWKHGDSTAQITVTQDGVYVLSSTSEDGCSMSDSLRIAFSTRPSLRFLEDTIIASPDEFEVAYQSNGDSFSWNYQGDTSNDYRLFKPSGNYYLGLHAFTSAGCWRHDSILVRHYPLAAYIFPNAFSPNGDGHNEVWYFIHPDTLGELTIYDRWGAVVFRGHNAWNGKKLNEPLPLGRYTYVFRPVDAKDAEVVTGSIQLIR